MPRHLSTLQNSLLESLLYSRDSSHNSKEKVMRCKKNATHIRISEDLAPGIKTIFDEVSSNRRFLNIDSVWTIDGKIKFRSVVFLRSHWLAQ